MSRLTGQRQVVYEDDDKDEICNMRYAISIHGLHYAICDMRTMYGKPSLLERTREAEKSSAEGRGRAETEGGNRITIISVRCLNLTFL